MKIVDFWEIVDNHSIKLLDVYYHPKNNYTDEQLEILDNHWTMLYDEFYSKRSNKSGKYMMDKNLELSRLSLLLKCLYELENRCILLINLEEQLELRGFVVVRMQELIQDFKSNYPKVKVNMFNSPRDMLELIQSVIKAQTNIFDEKVGVKEKNIEKQIITIHSVISRMMKNLGYALDINNMTCMEFIGHEETINELSKNQ